MKTTACAPTGAKVAAGHGSPCRASQTVTHNPQTLHAVPDGAGQRLPELDIDRQTDTPRRDPRGIQEAGERLRQLLQRPEDQAKLVEFILTTSERHPASRTDRYELLDRLEAEAAIGIHTCQPDEEHRGRLYLATAAAEPEGLGVVVDNVVRFWETGDLPARWTA